MRRLPRLTFRRNQRGAALLMLLLIFLLGAAYAVMGGLSVTALQIERQNRTTEVLALGKAALIAWSVLQGDIGTGTNPRPGTLPCPDTNNSGQQKGSCKASSGTTIGRLPWKTLGIEDLRDPDGERLWYAISDNFRLPGSNNQPINSDTLGSLQLYASDGTSLLTPANEELAAIVFSAGPALAGQDRGTAPNNATNYLDAANTRNNAIASGPFITGPIKNAQGEIILNDRLLAISAQELIGSVEKRVLQQVQKALADYASANGGKYPNPAKPNGTNCAAKKASITSTNSCDSDPSVCFGRLPEDLLWHYMTTDWFQQNGWGRVMTYTANKNSVLNSSAAECSTSLNVDGQAKSYVIIASGSRRSGQARPSTALLNYLEDTENQDAWTSLASGQASFSSPKASSNDQLRSLP
jgi:hypothetical protein